MARESKLLWVVTFAALLLGIAGLFMPAPALVQGDQVGAMSALNAAIKCGAGSSPCVQSNWGRDIVVYSDDGSTQKFKVSGTNGNTTVAGTLAVTGAQTYSALLNANAGIAVDTSAFTVADATGNTVISGTLTVTNTTTLQGAATINNNATVTGTLNVTGSGITGTLTTAAQPNITNLGTQGYFTATNATITSGTVTTATVTSLSMGGETFSGPLKYGTAASYTSGASITHGFAVTPTVCFINPVQAITSTYTITATGFSSNMPTTGSPIYWMCGK